MTPRQTHNTPAAKAERERRKLRDRLTVREHQFTTAVKSLKKIIEFRSAHLSVFETEVHELQREALQCLLAMENEQRGPKKLVPAAMRRPLLAPLRPEVLWQPLYDYQTVPRSDDET